MSDCTELRQRLFTTLYQWHNGGAGPQMEAILPLVEREIAASVAAILDRFWERLRDGWSFDQAREKAEQENPSDALREQLRLARLEELELLNKHLEHNEWADIGSNCCERYMAERIAALQRPAEERESQVV